MNKTYTQTLWENNQPPEVGMEVLITSEDSTRLLCFSGKVCEVIGINKCKIKQGLGFTTVTFYDRSLGLGCCVFDKDYVKFVPSEYTKANFEKASLAVMAFENNECELFALGKDDRYYKLTTAPAICKHFCKGSLYVNEIRNE